nr:phage tape measure protein [uncultured Mediterranean phage uvMED]
MAKFVIEVRTKGFAVAKADLKETAAQSRKFAREANGAANSSAIFRREVSKLRNNMLLYTFAVAGAVRVMGSFFRASMEFEKTKARLEGLTGSAEEAAKTFEIFNEAAKKTQFGIQQITAAGAQLEAFGINSKATIRILSDLASFMGRDIGLAAFAMGRAFSAGAAASEIFKEAGITNIIKTSQSIDDLTKLTLPEFRVAMMKTFVDSASGIQGSTERIQKTTEGMIMNLQDEFVNLQARIGDQFVPTLKTVIGALTEFVKSLDSKNVSILATNIAVLTGALKLNAVGFATAFTSAKAFSMVLLTIMNRLAILAAMNIVATRLIELAQEFELFGMKVEEVTEKTIDMDKAEQDMIQALEQATEVTKKAGMSQEELNKAIATSELRLNQQYIALTSVNELQKQRNLVLLNENRKLNEHEVRMITLIQTIKDRTKAEKEALKVKQQLLQLEEEQSNALINFQQEQVVLSAELSGATDLEVSQLQNLADFHSTLADNINLTAGQKSLAIDITKDATDATQLETFKLQGLTDAENQLLESIKSVFAVKAQLIDKNNEEAESLKNNKDIVKDAATKNRQLAQSITMAAGAMKQLGDNSMTAEQRLSAIMSTVGSLLMMMPGGQVAGSFLQAGSMFIGHTGGLIGNSGIQRFAQGGMVQGQDNVPIMAQAGEFIMKRDAVQNIGIDNLHSMNQGGAAPVTVNINGGIVQEDFVRNELMPQIHKSIKNDLA